MIPFECVTDGMERGGVNVAGFETFRNAGEEENGSVFASRAPLESAAARALDDDVLSREKPSDGKVALARALAVASADDAALGQTRGIRELAPFFVLLRRLAAVPEYAAAMAPAALAGARESAAAAAASLSAPRGSATARSAAADEKALLRLAFLSRVLGGTRGSERAFASLETIRDVANVANGHTPPLLDSLRVVAEASRARDAARGGRTDAAVSASAKGEKGQVKRRKTNHGENDDANDVALFARDAIDPLGPLDERMGTRNVSNETKETSRGVTRRARFGDPRFATSAEAFSDEPAAHANVADAADALGASLGFGAALDPIPPFAPAGSRALHEARVTRVRESDANLGSDLFEARLFETAAGLVARLAEISNLRDSASTRLFDAASKHAWLAILAGALVSPRRSKRCGSRRVARRALLALAGSKRAYRAARDAATLASLFERLARAALPAPGAWFEQRAPYAALLEASSCLASASALAAARPESWRRFVAGNTEALAAVATLAAWASEPARLHALALLARAAPHGDEEASTLGGAALRRASGFGLSATGTITVGTFHRDRPRGGSETRSEAEAVDRAAAEAATSLVVGSDFSHFFRFFLGRARRRFQTRRAPPRARWRARLGARPRAARAFGARWRARRSRRFPAWRRSARARARRSRSRAGSPSRRRPPKTRPPVPPARPRSARISLKCSLRRPGSWTRSRTRWRGAFRTLETHPNAPAYAALRARNAGDVKPAAESAESSNLRFPGRRVHPGDGPEPRRVRRRGDSVYAGFELERFVRDAPPRDAPLRRVVHALRRRRASA
jgi:hypothetical protein